MKWGKSVTTLVAGCTALLMMQYAQSQPAVHTPWFSPFIDNNINGFWEYLPRNYNTDVLVRYPLLIFIHGAGEQGSIADTPTLNKVLRAGPPRIINNGNFPDSFSVAGQSYKFIVLSPQIKNGILGSTSIIAPATVEALIQYARSTYRIDTTRIYLCGLSMGGGATWDYAGSSASAARKLAAIAVAAGAGDLSTDEANNIAAANLPVVATHNAPDNVISITRTQTNIDLILAYGPTIFPLPRAVYWNNGSHNVWSRTFENIVAGASPTGNLRDTLGINIYEWFLQFALPSAILPLAWQSFTVRAQNNTANLYWTVSNQVNVKEYTLERSRNGSQWTSIATVPTKPGTGVLSYSYSDPSVEAGVTYYRIKQTDNNGRFSYSAIKQCNIDGVTDLLVYPNPFVDELRIDAKLPANVTIRLANANGRILVSQQHTPPANSELIIRELNSLLPGFYYLTVTDRYGQPLLKRALVKQ
ncbi:MAG TPA: T9SS type A sorting domain-containing protein [Chitinophagaceae bacterium]|nr:T9SS type A sorting domain-containing protein [Chitinophagaceae bacterium]